MRRLLLLALLAAAHAGAAHDVVPGTSMRFWGIKDEQQVADLLSYMRTLK
jgi:cytochrome c